MSFTVTKGTPGSAELAVDTEAYSRFVNESPQGIMYCQRWWLDAVAPERYEILIVKKGDALKAAWPLVYGKQGDRSRIIMPPMTQKLGILFAPSTAKYAERLSHEQRMAELLLEHLPKHRVFEQRFHEKFTDWLPFYWSDFTQSTRYTYVIEDLSNMETVWGNMREARRRAIRKAEKQNIVVREIDDIEYFYQLNMKTFSRQNKKAAFDLSHVTSIDAALQANAGRRMTIAEDSEGRVHACDYLAYDERMGISLLGGADPELRSSGAQVLLEWESIKFTSTLAPAFDFEGSMVHNIEHFMRGFGATQRPYFDISRRCSNYSLDRLDQRVRQQFASSLRRMAERIDPTS